MFSSIEQNPHRAIYFSGAFALIGIIALIVVFLQQPEKDETTFSDVFPDAASEEALAAKHDVLDQLSASSETEGETSLATEEEKLDVLKALRGQ